VIGGVLSSLILTMLLVPNAYVWMAPKQVTPNAKSDDEPLAPPHLDGDLRPAPAGVS
jgi:hypothetical protein